ncbi:MAG: PAS domain S-box protein [Sporomusaceae bacterium]|nr:PAS domain S-box protein [Sporomusaceae bacterium]
MTAALDILKKKFEQDTLWEIFDLFPVSISIATDNTCKEIIHNSKASHFFRIEPCQSFSYSTPEKNPLPRFFHNGREISDREMPLQRSALFGETCVGFEFDLVWDDGITKTGLLNSCPLYSKEGIIVGSLATFEDITERKQVENELNKSRRELEQLVREQSQLLDLTHDFIIVVDLNSKIMYWNHSAELGYGWTQKEASGQVIHSLLQTEFPEPIESIMDSLATKGSWEGELVHWRKDGERIVVKSHWTLKTDASGDPVSILEINRDITAQRKCKNEILRLDQLNTIGEMAAGIGHEIRNPLTTVRGYLQMFGMKKKFFEYKEQFNTMIEELDRANSIITEYLSLAKDKSSPLECGNLNKVIETLFPLLQADAFFLGHNVQLETSTIPPIYFDKKEFRQLLLNLVRNGLEAMKPGGVVLIRTYCNKDKVILSVQDNGPGVPEEILDRLGTPFLTTKKNGTGLGLMVCYRIVERHHGIIEVETNSSGTTFSVHFNQPAY